MNPGSGNDYVDGGGGDTYDIISFGQVSGSADAAISQGIQMTWDAADGHAVIIDGWGDTDIAVGFEAILGTKLDDKYTLSGDLNQLAQELNFLDALNSSEEVNGDTLIVDGNQGANISLIDEAITIGSEAINIKNFENVIGSTFNDTITGNSSKNIIDSGGGDDIVYGGEGSDTLDGGENADGSEDSDALTYQNLAYGVQSRLLTPAAGDVAAVYSISRLNPDPMEPDGWTDKATNFENFSLTQKTDLLHLNGSISDWASLKIHDGGSPEFDSGSDTNVGTEINIAAYTEKAITGFTAYGDVLSLEGLSVAAGDEVRIQLDDQGDRYSADQASGYIEQGGSHVELVGFDDVIGSGARDMIVGSDTTNYLFGLVGDDTLVAGEMPMPHRCAA